MWKTKLKDKFIHRKSSTLQSFSEAQWLQKHPQTLTFVWRNFSTVRTKNKRSKKSCTLLALNPLSLPKQLQSLITSRRISLKYTQLQRKRWNHLKLTFLLFKSFVFNLWASSKKDRLNSRSFWGKSHLFHNLGLI